MQAKEESILNLKSINSDSEEEPRTTEKQRSNSLSEELIQRGRGRPKKDQRPRTGSIDVFLSPRTEKRKLKESPEEENKKEIKKKCNIDMDEMGTELKALLAQLLDESRKGREEQGEIKKAIMDLTNKFANIETRTKQIEERLKAEERNVEMMKDEMEKHKLDLERTKKRIDSMEGKIGKLSEKNKEFEKKEKMIESQLENSNIKYEERKWEEWEREKRKNNIIIKGIGTNERIDKRKIEEWIEEKLGVKVKLNKIWIIKKLMLVGAECRNKEEKVRIMENKKKLKGTKFYVDNDLTYKERRNKEELWKIAKKFRDQGKTVKIGYNKIIVDEEVSKWDEWKGKLFRRSYNASRSQH